MSDDRQPTLSHRLEHAAFMGTLHLSKLLGPRLSNAFGGAVGTLGYFPLRFRRSLVERHLRMAFPEKADAWIHATARAAYAHLGREALSAIRLRSMTKEQLVAMTSMPNAHVLQNALAKGKGVILASGHVGNQEITAASVAARGFPLDVVAQRQHNPLFDAALNAARARMGVHVIDRAHAAKLVTKSLRQGHIVGFAADQNAGKAGIFIPFFGHLASTHRGAALFAVKAGAPLVLVMALNRGEGYEVLVEEVDVDRSGPVEDVVYRLTVAFTRRLEEVVRMHPDQYLWHHRRWKTRPPEERPTDKQV